MPTNHVVRKSHVSAMPIRFQTLDAMLVWIMDDKCLDIMLPSVGGMVTSPCSVDRLTSSA